MKVLLFTLFLSLPILIYGQTSIVASGGIGTNTFNKGSYLKKMAIAPTAELGFYNLIYKNNKIGMILRYNTFNAKGGYWLEDKKVVLRNNVVSIMMVIGAGFNAGKIKMHLSANGGLALSDKYHGFVIGWKYDALYPITNVFGVTFGLNADYYKIEKFKEWFFPAKLGVDIRL